MTRRNLTSFGVLGRLVHNSPMSYMTEVRLGDIIWIIRIKSDLTWGKQQTCPLHPVCPRWMWCKGTYAANWAIKSFSASLRIANSFGWWYCAIPSSLYHTGSIVFWLYICDFLVLQCVHMSMPLYLVIWRFILTHLYTIQMLCFRSKSFFSNSRVSSATCFSLNFGRFSCTSLNAFAAISLSVLEILNKRWVTAIEDATFHKYEHLFTYYPISCFS